MSEALFAAAQGVFQPFVPRVVSRSPRVQDGAADHDRVASIEPPETNAAATNAAAATFMPDQSSDGAVPAFERDEPQERDRALGLAGEVVTFDEGRCAAHVREEAIRLAGAACARALHEAIAKNRLFVARFVDDAIEAVGRAACTRIRLSPADAEACDGRVPIDVAADGDLASGEVVVESASGTARATVEQRADLLVRAAAEA